MKRFILLISLCALTNVIVFSQDIPDTIYYKGSKGLPFLYKEKKLRYDGILRVMESNPFAYQEMVFAKTNRNLASITFATGMTLIIWPVVTDMTNGDANWSLIGIGIPILAFSVPLKNSSDLHTMNAIRIYNNKIPKFIQKSNIDMKLGLFNNGVGMRLLF
jgi:hypothetical protein